MTLMGPNGRPEMRHEHSRAVGGMGKYPCRCPVPSPLYAGGRVRARGRASGTSARQIPATLRPITPALSPACGGEGVSGSRDSRPRGADTASNFRRPLRRRGYVLVVTLAVLVLAAGMMVGLGRAAGQHAARAREARDDLQRRWGAASCRAAVLPVAERLLLVEERRTGGPVPALRAAVRLGGQRFELMVADEQAKADVNALLADAGGADVSAVENRVRAALAGHGLANRVRLRPEHRPPTAAAGGWGTATKPSSAGRVIGGLGQILDAVPPDRWLRPPPGGGPAPADLLTCWGGGAVNVRRVSEPTLRLAASPPLTGVEVARVVEVRQEVFFASRRPIPVPGRQPGEAGRARSPVRRLVDDAGLAVVGGRLLPRFVDGSTCHSVWVAADDGRRRSYALAVHDASDPQRPQWYNYAW